MIQRTTHLTVLLAAAAVPVSMAGAVAVTPVSPPGGSERSHAEIFGDLYGGSFTPSGDDFSNGLMTLIRIGDDQDETYNFSFGFDASAQAVYAGFDQHFGYTTDAGGYVELFSVAGTQGTVSAQATGINIDGDFQFVRTGPRGVTASTQSGDNVDGIDHVVTYLVENPQAGTLPGQAPAQQYLLFFDDGGGNPSDHDFNDLVVLVTAQTATVPEPGSMALLGIGACLLIRRRR